MKSVFAAISIIAGLSLLTGCVDERQLTVGQMNTASLGARQFSDNGGYIFLSCSGQDSDRDGYTTCTIKDKTTSAMSSILCSYENAAGCKPK